MTSASETPHELGVKQMTRSTMTAEVLAHAARYARKKHLEDVLIIDVDAHHFETGSWASVIEYIEDPVWRDIAQSFTLPDGTNMGALGNYQPGFNYQHVGGRIPHSGGMRGEPIDDKTVHRDVILARRAMESMAIDYQVIFPTPMLSLGLHPSAEQEVALAFAYNRWLCEEVLSGDDRLTALIYLPFNDPEASLRTVEEFAGKPGVAGFNITSVRHKPVHHNHYMKVYAAIEEAGVPLGFHAGPTWEDQWMRQLDRFIGVHALSFVLCNMVHLTKLGAARPARTLPQPQRGVDRIGHRLGAVHDAAARQRVPDALGPRRRCSRSCRAITSATCTSHRSPSSATT